MLIGEIDTRELGTREDDEFERMQLVVELERDRGLIAQYEEHQAFYRGRGGGL